MSGMSSSPDTNCARTPSSPLPSSSLSSSASRAHAPRQATVSNERSASRCTRVFEKHLRRSSSTTRTPSRGCHGGRRHAQKQELRLVRRSGHLRLHRRRRRRRAGQRPAGARGAAAERKRSSAPESRQHAPQLRRRPPPAGDRSVANHRCAPCTGAQGVSTCNAAAVVAVATHFAPVARPRLSTTVCRLNLGSLNTSAKRWSISTRDFAWGEYRRCQVNSAAVLAGSLDARLGKTRKPRVAVNRCKPRVRVHCSCRLVARLSARHAAPWLLLHSAASRATATRRASRGSRVRGMQRHRAGRGSLELATPGCRAGPCCRPLVLQARALLRGSAHVRAMRGRAARA